MYTALKESRPLDFVKWEVFPLGSSLVIAELFYKFGSFSLECVAFIGTWFAISFALHTIVGKRGPSQVPTKD